MQSKIMPLLLSIALYLLTAVESQCGFHEYREELLHDDSFDEQLLLATWEEMEVHYEEEVEYWEDHPLRRIRRLATDSDLTSKYFNGTLEIPVIVHVLYNPSHTVNLNTVNYLKHERIQSQIIRLNMDFLSKNTETISNSAFAALKANYSISFKLHKVIKTQTAITEFDFFGEFGVIAPIDPKHYLNLYVSVFKDQFSLGYCSFPGYPESHDACVMNYKFFGDPTFLWITSKGEWKNTIAPVSADPNIKTTGRTTTHEVGHWLFLEHVWGNAGGCSDDDHVADTPTQQGAYYECPNDNPQSCNSADMYQNFMDYTDDNCMALFSKGQLIRSLSILNQAYGQGRKELVDYQSVTEYTQGPFVNDIYFRPSLTKESDVNKICGPGDLLVANFEKTLVIGSTTYYIYGCFSTTNNKYVDVITNIWTSTTLDNNNYCVESSATGYVCYSKGAYSNANRMTSAQFNAKIASLNI